MTVLGNSLGEHAGVRSGAAEKEVLLGTPPYS
jgi:hypothetical protein